MDILTINDISLPSLAEFILFAGKILSSSLCKRQIIVREPRVHNVLGVHKSRKSYGDLSVKLIEITDGFSLFL